jgi:hypothetical protein
MPVLAHPPEIFRTKCAEGPAFLNGGLTAMVERGEAIVNVSCAMTHGFGLDALCLRFACALLALYFREIETRCRSRATVGFGNKPSTMP